MKRLILLATLMTIGSGCTLLKDPIREPLCLPNRPYLLPITVEEQIEINPQVLDKIATNDVRLKSHIKMIEDITIEHNKQFRAQCAE